MRRANSSKASSASKARSAPKTTGRKSVSRPAARTWDSVVGSASSLPTLEEGRKLYLETHGRALGGREDLQFQFTAVVTQFSRRWRNWLNERLAVLGQTQARVEALFWIEVACGRATQRELAERVGIEGPTFARMLDTLENEGLVERIVSSDDRRTKTIALKKHATAGLRGIGELMSESRNHLLQEVDEKQLAECIALMRLLMKKLERK